MNLDLLNEWEHKLWALKSDKQTLAVKQYNGRMDVASTSLTSIEEHFVDKGQESAQKERVTFAD